MTIRTSGRCCEYELPYLNRLADPQRYARWQALRRQLVQAAVTLPQPHIIEGTHILAAPELTHRAPADPGRYALAPDYPATSGAGSRQVRRGPRTVRRTACWRAGLYGGPAARWYTHGRSTKACDWRLTPSGNSLGSKLCQVVRSKPGCHSRERPARTFLAAAAVRPLLLKLQWVEREIPWRVRQGCKYWDIHFCTGFPLLPPWWGKVGMGGRGSLACGIATPLHPHPRPPP